MQQIYLFNGKLLFFVPEIFASKHCYDHNGIRFCFHLNFQIRAVIIQRDIICGKNRHRRFSIDDTIDIIDTKRLGIIFCI